MGSVYSVGQVNQYIKNMFAQDYLLHDISIRGEVSNCKYHSTGHIYFTLKEEGAAIACVLFATYKRTLSFRLEDGNKVIVRGSVESYVRDGKYQIYVKSVERDGEGDLFLAFEELKKKLSAQGMFDEEYKRPIPELVSRVGIVTAPTGAAIRDIISVSKRRNPYIELIIAPAIVQGEEAPASIVAGIEQLEKYGVDVIIVGRGGGSMEDLWGFNDEMVAHAIFQCEVPVISAVGHETDFTIADFVSDLRAPTPSAAAELAVCDIEELFSRIASYEQMLQRRMQEHLRIMKMKLSFYSDRLHRSAPLSKVKEQRMELVHYEERLQTEILQVISHKRKQMELYIERMKAQSPLEKLSSGMAYVSGKDGVRCSGVSGLSEGDELLLRMKDGVAEVSVLSVDKGVKLNGNS